MHDHEWLFPQNFEVAGDGQSVSGPRTSEEYLHHFDRKNRLFLLRCPTPYLFTLLENHREKIAFSSHITTERGIIPYTILQLDAPSQHLICDWSWDESNERFLFATTLFASSQLDYVKFLKANREFECPLHQGTMGFAATAN